MTGLEATVYGLIYFTIGSVMAFLIYVWSICYKGKAYADYHADEIILLSIVFWSLIPIGITLYWMVRLTEQPTMAIKSKLDSMNLSNPIEALAVKLARKCTEYKEKSKGNKK